MSEPFTPAPRLTPPPPLRGSGLAHRPPPPTGDGSPVPIHLRTRPLRALAAQLEESDPYTGGHSRRVARHSTLIGARLGLPTGALRRLRTAAMLHDVGKIAVPSTILHKPGRLTASEYAVIQSHADRGAEMVQERVGDPELVAIVRHHHERYDGTGYPRGLRGRRIPQGARIIAVADTFDAIASRRPYRRAGSFEEALSALVGAAGSQLDPEIVATFCALQSSPPGMGHLDLLTSAGGALLSGAPGGRWAPRVPGPITVLPRAA